MPGKQHKALADRVDKLVAEIEAVRDELQAYYDDKSEKWQDSDDGADCQSAIDEADSAADGMGSVLDYLKGGA